jgi:predicted nucleotidyltransferase
MAGPATVQDDRVAEVVRRLVAAADPDKIVVFGSRAKGSAGPDSDMDLLIIKDSTQPRHRRTAPLYAVLRGLGVAADILWFTPAEVQDWSGARNFISTVAIREGQVVYEKRP